MWQASQRQGSSRQKRRPAGKMENWQAGQVHVVRPETDVQYLY